MIELASRSLSFTRARTRVGATPLSRIGVTATAAAVASVLGVFLRAWPPHEDEALALFVGRDSLGGVLHTVVAERGGAPLHFLFAWAIVHLGGGLTALRLVSLLFAVASVPAIAALATRLADRLTGLVTAVLASGTWVLLFHGVYGRMYSLFLFTSALSFIALLEALERGGRRRFLLWGLALLAMLATHPYAALVVASQGVYVLLRRWRVRAALITFAGVAVAGIPFWWADVVLRSRFDVGLGGGGSQLGSLGAVLHYFWWVSGDMSAGHHAWSLPVLLLALGGLVLLTRSRRESALLTACVIAVPAVALVAARLHSTASPEARHLIFALPFFSVLLAVPLVELGRLRPAVTAPLALAVLVVLVGAEVRWADQKTPPLFHGDPPGEARARDSAGAWLAADARPDDVLLGYEPVYLRAWELRRSLSHNFLPRADADLLTTELGRISQPLGRGVWVLDASDTTNDRERQTIPFALPRPSERYEGRVFGPYLVIRSRARLGTPQRYLAVSEDVMRLGRRLQIGDAGVNLHALVLASGR